MPEFPDDVMAGIDRPRPLSEALAARLTDALLGDAEAVHAARPLGDALSARLVDELADPFATAIVGIDAPRPLRAEARRTIEHTLTGESANERRRRWLPVLGAAAALVVLGAAGSVLALSAGTGPHAQAGRASVPSHAGRIPGGTSSTSGKGLYSATVPGAAGRSAQSPSVNVMPNAAAGVAAPAASSGGPIVTGLSPASGPSGGGTWVTISGNGFAAAGAVRFGTTPALGFVVVSPNVVRAQAPAHAPGVVDVMVSGPAGTTPTSPADRYTYTG